MRVVLRWFAALQEFSMIESAPVETGIYDKYRSVKKVLYAEKRI